MSDILHGKLKVKDKTFHLPPEIIDVIKTYTGEGLWRNGKFVIINKLNKSDNRYKILSKMPKIKQIYNSDREFPLKGGVWFKSESGKFVVINVINHFRFKFGTTYQYADIWEMYYDKKIIQLLIR